MYRPTTDLALQHVLQSGLAVVRNQPLAGERRTQVLRALVEIFSDADRGSQAVGAHNLLISVEEPPAFERFVLFFRYLHQSLGNDLPARLSEATAVFSGIENNADQAADAKARVAALIEGVLAAISRENALAPLAAPKDVQLSF